MANSTKKECFIKFYSKLVGSPLCDLTSTFYSHGLLPGNHKDKVDSLSTEKEKAQYFLDKVIKPGIEVGNAGPLDDMLRIMETSDNSTLQHVAGEMKKCMDGQSPAETSPKKMSPSLDLYKPKPVVKFSESLNIESAFTRMTSEIESVLELKKFSKLRRACVQRINSLGSNLPRNLVPKIQQTRSLDDMLDVLAQSPYWNWFDTRLLQALVSASGSVEAEEWLETFKATFYAEKITKLIPYVTIKPFKESIDLVEKFDKDPKDLTVSELLQHKYKLEYEVLDIDEGELVLSCIKTGCVELTWQVPQELVYRVYASMKRKHDELSSLAVKSLVCGKADKIAGLPYLWHGQEVGEVGPIEPLPEHVRQEPYSLPQGFQWVTLSSSDVEEVVKFINHNSNLVVANNSTLHFFLTHPRTRSEWLFGVRTTNGKLVGVVLAYPVCMSIGGVSVMCPYTLVNCHRKYHNKRMFYMLNKELQRRISVNRINQYFCMGSFGLLKPVSTITRWRYHFTHATSAQLSNSPRTPGWRKMTSDVPSALALVNKYSSQFEIRQVFTSEEFSHHFLCPTVPNFVFTYVVENETNNITELVMYKLIKGAKARLVAIITIVISTHSPVKQLMTDVMVCARNTGVDTIDLFQFDIQDGVLLSLGFQQIREQMLYFYNYKCHPSKCFHTL